jgi:hypothetical protein
MTVFLEHLELLGLWTLSIVRYSKEQNISETGQFPSSGDRGWEAPTLLGPLERATLSHWETYNTWIWFVGSVSCI